MSALSLIHLVVFVLWLPVALIGSLFIFWRILHHEHVDDLEGVIDRAVLASLLSVIVARLGYIATHVQVFQLSLSRWLDGVHNPGLLSVVGVAAWLLIFWRLVASKWKDPIGLLDFAVIPLSFFFFCFAFMDVMTQLVGVFTAAVSKSDAIVPLISIRGVLSSFLVMAVELFLVVLLQRLEQVYRTFLWYRAKRRSAQTGFVLAVFLLVYGLSGFLLGLLSPSVDSIGKLLVMVAGFVVLYLRSGRGLPFTHKGA